MGVQWCLLCKAKQDAVKAAAGAKKQGKETRWETQLGGVLCTPLFIHHHHHHHHHHASYDDLMICQVCSEQCWIVQDTSLSPEVIDSARQKSCTDPDRRPLSSS
eukprot:1146208-Pelagomonas_calceolata.AAC.12